MAAIRCSNCDQVLGETIGPAYSGLVLIKHKGREITCVVTTIRCDECGTIWRSPIQHTGSSLDGIETKKAAV